MTFNFPKETFKVGMPVVAVYQGVRIITTKEA